MLDSIRRDHGRLRGLVDHWWSLALLRAGHLESFRVRGRGIAGRRLVFVCSGNICRSPFAEAVAQRLGRNAMSFGLEADEGAPPWQPVTEMAGRRGLQMENARARRFDRERFLPGDLALAFEVGHAREIRRRLASHVDVALLGLLLPEPRPHLQDPYGLGMPYLVRCLDRIELAVERLVASA